MAVSDTVTHDIQNEDEMNRPGPDLSGKCYPYGTRHSAEMIRDLSARAYEYRTHVLRIVYGRKSGHIGGALYGSRAPRLLPCE
jgi:hypothetical protein